MKTPARICSIVLLLLLGVFARAQAPTGDFSSNFQTIAPGQAIQFTYNCTGSSSACSNLKYLWEFEGGTTTWPGSATGWSGAAAPIVSYATPGIYRVKLRVSNSSGSGPQLEKPGYIWVTNEANNMEITGREDNHWITTMNTRVDFWGATGISTNSQFTFPNHLNQYSNTSSISNADGRLLFFTNGDSIWDRHYKKMNTSTALNYHGREGQGSLIVRRPGSLAASQQYYVFHSSTSGLYYSIVDMNLRNGLGDLLPGSVNVLLATNVTYQVTAIPNCNGTDYWIITHRQLTNEYLVFNLTATGITGPATYSIGLAPTGTTYPYAGFIKGSPQGNKIGMLTFDGPAFLEVCDFDRATGAVGGTPNTVMSSSPWGVPGGFDFSPSGRFLYVSTGYRVWQYDLQLGGAPVQLMLPTTWNYVAEDVNLGPDNRIYVGYYDVSTSLTRPSSFMGRIGLPDVGGIACAFTNLFPVTSAGQNYKNLINNYASRYLTPFNIKTQDTMCNGGTLVLDGGPAHNGYLWSTGATTQTITVTEPGFYWVDVFDFGCRVRIPIKVLPTIMPGAIQELTSGLSCQATSHTLHGKPGYNTYIWTYPGGATAWTQNITITGKGVYTLLVTKGSCAHQESIRFGLEPSVFTTQPALYCETDPEVPLSATPTGGHFFSKNPAHQTFYMGLESFYPNHDYGNNWRVNLDVYYTYKDTLTRCSDTSNKVAFAIINKPKAVLNIPACAPSLVRAHMLDCPDTLQYDSFAYEWYRDNVLMPGETQESLMAPEEGVYKVRIRAKAAPAGCYTEYSTELFNCCVADPNDIRFNKFFTDPTFLSRNFYQVDMQVLPDGGTIILGRESNGVWVANQICNFFLARIDKMGNMKWMKRYNYASHFIPVNLVYVNNGYTVMSNASGMVYITRTDMDGNIQWQTYHGESHTGFTWVNVNGAKMIASYDAANNFDGYLAVGSANNNGGQWANLYVLKMDVNGQMQWRRMYTLPSTHPGSIAGVDVILSRVFNGGLPDSYVILSQVEAISDTCAHLLRIPLNASTIWFETKLGGNAVNPQGNIARFNGVIQSFRGGHEDGYAVLSNYSNIFLTKVDPYLNFLWKKRYYLNNLSDPNDIYQDIGASSLMLYNTGLYHINGYALAGYRNMPGPFNGSGTRNIILLTDLDGNGPYLKTHNAMGGGNIFTNTPMMPMPYGSSIHMAVPPDYGYYAGYFGMWDRPAPGAAPRLIKTDPAGDAECTETMTPNVLAETEDYEYMPLTPVGTYTYFAKNVAAPTVHSRNTNFICCVNGTLIYRDRFSPYEFDNTSFVICDYNIDFDANLIAMGPDNYTFNFNQLSDGMGGSFLWTFGDGGTSTAANPSHTYTGIGPYIVCVEIVMPDGCKAKKCKTINICDHLGIILDLDIAIIGGGDFGISYNVLGIDESEIVSKTLDFGDGIILNVTGPPISIVHHYNFFFDYTVCFTVVLRNGCVRQICKTVHYFGKRSLNVSETPTSSPNSAVSVYPNPNAGTFWYVFEGDQASARRQASVEVIDYLGRVVWSAEGVRSGETRVINIENEAAGLYTIRTVTSDKVFTHTVMKK